MQNFITTTGIKTGSRTVFQKSAFITGQVKNLLASLHRILCIGDRSVQFGGVIYDFNRGIKAGYYSIDGRQTNDMVINIYL